MFLFDYFLILLAPHEKLEGSGSLIEKTVHRFP